MPRREPYASDGEESSGESISFKKPESAANSGTEDAEQEEEYIVEKIVGHNWTKAGKLRYLVKWKGYDNPADETAEPEQNLENAPDALMDYFQRIGGRPEKPVKAPAKRRKTSRATSATSQPASHKKRRVASSSVAETPEGDEDKGTPATEAPSADKKAKKEQQQQQQPRQPAEKKKDTTTAAAKDKQAQPQTDGDESTGSPAPSKVPLPDWVPRGTWENHVSDVDTITRDQDTGGLFVFLRWNDGHKCRVSINQAYKKCPQKMLKFYEGHLVFKED